MKDEYIFFSQSLENLSNLYFGFYEENNDIYYKRNSGLLLNSENWKKVSENQSLNATISLYYDLQRGIPSFLQEDKTFAKILKLYNIGRFDVLTKNESLFLELDAISDDISD